ncbi:MAG: helix-turn-helix domain-containing protein, partial [Thermoanaerobaculia bacterium]|nr:helix-turn-helix domain-containing protein [Thermoanaerobaculia bacterium]
YRLKVVQLEIPPLRRRTGDLPLLCEHFLREFCAEHGRPEMRLSAPALDALGRYPWPGNVRELRNVLESVVIFHPGGEIEVEDLPAEVRGAPPASTAEGAPVQSPFGEPRTMADIERRAIFETLERTGGKRAEAAKILGIGLRTLQRKLKEYRSQGLMEE